MAHQSLNTYKKTEKVRSTHVVYNLIFKNALYDLECYREGYEGHWNYSYIENLTDDEGEAETFLKIMAKGKVMPVHIKDMSVDYFRK